MGSVGWTYVPNSNWVNSARFGYSHYYQTFNSGDGSDDPANYSFNGSTFDSLHGADESGLLWTPDSRIGFGFFPVRVQLGASYKTVGPDSVWQFSDSVSYLRGNHSFKFGGEVLVNQSTNIVTNNTKGPLQFAATEDPLPMNFFPGAIQNANITAGDFFAAFAKRGVCGVLAG